jgi:undecaprenyl-phosphate 4-deoxy-4-formamido-L-arabinose transferase
MRRIFIGPEVEGVFTLFAIAIFLMGLLLFAVGVLGEYIGRINMQVRKRQRYRIARMLDTTPPIERHESVAGEPAMPLDAKHPAEPGGQS